MQIRGKSYTGRGQVVAIVDSGVDVHDPRLGGADISGMSLRLSAAAHVEVGNDFRDENGHGTEIAAAIHAAAPEARLLCVKIMDAELRTIADLIAAGIELAARNAQVINLSLGTPNMGTALLLRDCCTAAMEAGAVLVAAGHPRGERAYPADLPETIGVLSHPDCGPERIWHFAPARFPTRAWGPLADRFVANGWTVASASAPGAYRGPAIAAARVSGTVACLREAMEGERPAEVVAALRALASPAEPERGYS